MNIIYTLQLEFSDDSFNNYGLDYKETVAYFNSYPAAEQAINRLSVFDLLGVYRSIYMPGMPRDYILCEKEPEGGMPTRLYRYNGATNDIVDGNDEAWFRISIEPIYPLDIEDLDLCWWLDKKTNNEEDK